MDNRVRRRAELELEELMQRCIVLQAFLNGRQLQVWKASDDSWRDFDPDVDQEPNFNFYSYRVKPE